MAKKPRKNPNNFDSNSTAGSCILDRDLARHDAKQLGLNKGDLPNSIKEVIATLTQAGFEAYIVGGGVRDSLLGLKPKDFDAVTNATPNQIKDVFGKRCRIIGRRFQLCHVYSGRDMIEVATFRAPPKDTVHTTQDGMLMRDNVWGDIFQDVVRRDFSINALYYQPFDNIVYDFCGGLNDIESRTIRLLGDTQKRIEEDPVRLLRALRFKAKLHFNFDKALEQQFNPHNWSLLSQVSPHRLYDETQKMFTGGYLIPLLPLLFDYGAFSQLLFYPPSMITPLVDQVTINTDRRISGGKSINPAFFYATILWENYLYLLSKFKKNTPFAEAQIQAANKVMDKQRQHTAMPKFAEQFIKDIWIMQPRLAEPRKKNLLKLFENPRFRAGFDFLMLREQVEAKNKALSKTHGSPVTLDDESTNGMGHWWAWFQTLNPKQQQKALDEFDINEVRLRFANIVNQSSVTNDLNADFEQNAQASSSQQDTATRRGRRHQREDSTSEQFYQLSEQEQQEKAQLEQLSLACNDDREQRPAQSLWPQQSPQEQLAEPKADYTPNEHSNNKRTPVKRKSTTSQSATHSLSVPSQRQRRVPSSKLSILEQRQLAEREHPSSVTTAFTQNSDNTVETIDQSNTTDSVVKPKQKPSQTLAVVEPVIPDTTKPKRAPRPRKRLTTGDKQKDTPAPVETNAQVMTAEKPPVKRTRKRVVKSEDKAE